MKSSGGRDEAMELVAEIGRDFASTLDIEQTLGGALRRISGHVGAEGGALFMLDSARTALRCHASVGPVDIVGLTIAADQGIAGRAVQRNLGEIVRDVRRRSCSATNWSLSCAPGGSRRW
jgi:hypothetical protein